MWQGIRSAPWQPRAAAAVSVAWGTSSAWLGSGAGERDQRASRGPAFSHPCLMHLCAGVNFSAGLPYLPTYGDAWQIDTGICLLGGNGQARVPPLLLPCTGHSCSSYTRPPPLAGLLRPCRAQPGRCLLPMPPRDCRRRPLRLVHPQHRLRGVANMQPLPGKLGSPRRLAVRSVRTRCRGGCQRVGIRAQGQSQLSVLVSHCSGTGRGRCDPVSGCICNIGFTQPQTGCK